MHDALLSLDHALCDVLAHLLTHPHPKNCMCSSPRRSWRAQCLLTVLRPHSCGYACRSLSGSGTLMHVIDCIIAVTVM